VLLQRLAAERDQQVLAESEGWIAIPAVGLAELGAIA